MRISVIGAFAFVFGFFGTQRKQARRPLRIDWNVDRAFTLAICVLFGNIFYRGVKYFLGLGVYPPEHYNNLIGPIWLGVILFPSKYQLFAALIALIAYLALPAHSRKKYRNLIWFISLTLFLCGIITRSRTAVLAPLFCYSYVIALMGTKKELHSWAKFVVGFLPIVFVVKNLIRTVEDVSIGVGALTTGIAEVLQRVSMIVNLNAVVNYFDEPIMGDSIAAMFILSQRIFPDSVEQWALSQDTAYVGGNAFGQMLGLVSPNDSITGVALPLIGDFYINFGVYGVFFGMFIVAAFAKYCQNRAIHYPTCSGIFFFVAMVPLLLSGQENQFGIWLSEFLELVMIYLFIIPLLRSRLAR